MNVLLWIVLGVIAGWLASLLMKSPSGLFMDLFLGIIGALVGGAIMNFFGSAGVTGFNLYSLIVATVGAVVVIAIGRFFQTRSI